MRSRHILPLVFLVLLASCLCADWPQWRGPKRDGRSREKGLARSWPKDGPEKLWSAKGMGKGYSTVAVVGKTIYVTGMFGGKGKLVALKSDGSIRGKVSYGAEGGKSYPGARSTPTIDDGRIYIMSAAGAVICIGAKNGKIQWQIDTKQEFGAKDISWHITESLLIDGDNLICTPGGSSLMVALDKKTGRTVWKSKGGPRCRSAYCSPIVVDHNRKRIILTMVEKGAVGVDAKSGRVLWLHEHKNRHGVHAATPIYRKGDVFISSGYGYGAEMLRLSRDGGSVRRQWECKQLDNHHGGCIRIGDTIYGTNNRGLLALDFESGKIRWQGRGVGKGSTIAVNDMLIVYGEKGTVGLFTTGDEGCTLVGQFRVNEGDGQHWAHPVVANGRLYIRHGDVLMCYDVSGR